MLTLEQFESLQVGDTIEAPGLFQSLDPGEPVRLAVNEVDGTSKAFLVTYFGVTLGRWRCAKDGETLTWRT
jgi:hypothetical protein